MIYFIFTAGRSRMTPPLLNNFVDDLLISGFICASHYLCLFACSEAERDLFRGLFLCVCVCARGSVGLIRLHRHRYFSLLLALLIPSMLFGLDDWAE